MVTFGRRCQLYNFIDVPNLPSLHWSDSIGWLMATFMYDLVKEKHRAMLAAAQYISLTIDETSAVDNLSYIVIHVYILQDWGRIPLVLHLNKLESSNIIFKHVYCQI
jgi:hypothetical protein